MELARPRVEVHIGAIAARVLAEVLDGADAGRALKRALRGCPDLDNAARRALARRVLFTALHQGRLSFFAGGFSDLPPTARARALLAAHLFLDEGASPAGALTQVGSPPQSAEYGATLRRLEACRARPLAPPKDPVRRLAVTRSLPLFLARHFAQELGVDEADQLLRVMNEPGPVCLRANALVNDRDELAAHLMEDGIRTQPATRSPWGIVVGPSNEHKPNLWGSRAFREGRFEVQDEGSQLIALAARARPGERVIDLCAGRGGKTLALAAAMGAPPVPGARLIALDVDEGALRDLAVRIGRARIPWVEPRQLDAEWRAIDDLKGAADLVLVDAPCSSLGTLRRGPARRWQLPEPELSRWPEVQLSLLTQAARLLAPGGRLVYATCTLSAAENDDVVDALLAAHPALAPMPLPLAEAQGAARLTLLPHVHGTDGFFLAAVRRVPRKCRAAALTSPPPGAR